MSTTIMSDSLAAFRRRGSDELARLADEHLQHDLQPDDRETLKSAASTVSLWTAIGSTVGIGLGIYIAFRFRSTRKALFEAFRVQEKPTHVVFAGARTGMYIHLPICVTRRLAITAHVALLAQRQSLISPLC